MAKAKKGKKKPGAADAAPYKYMRAIINGGELRWEYQVRGLAIPGRMSHDEDVAEWTETDIIALTRSVLDVPADYPITVHYE